MTSKITTAFERGEPDAYKQAFAAIALHATAPGTTDHEKLNRIWATVNAAMRGAEARAKSFDVEVSGIDGN